uniref:LysM domain-containing protein n=1 Tax=Leersia perrieri TaxID=77586 RepID=A0A0D9VLI7_9ORYZ
MAATTAAAAAIAMTALLMSCAVEAKTTIEPCTGSDTCGALLGYTLYADMKVSEVAALFAVDPSALLAANALDFTAAGAAAHRILPMGLFLRVPTRCACADGVRKSVSVRYAARPGDTLAAVADGVFAGLASADQIRGANALASDDPDTPLDPGQKLVVPLPCVCFNSSDNNLPAVYLSYVVQVGDTVPAIAASYETTVTDVMNVNAMGSPVAAPGDILAIPLPACTSTFPKSASDHGLVVANGTYALTAGNCVQCSCGPGNLNLYCTPASLSGSCPSMQCQNSNVLLGNAKHWSSIQMPRTTSVPCTHRAAYYCEPRFDIPPTVSCTGTCRSRWNNSPSELTISARRVFYPPQSFYCKWTCRKRFRGSMDEQTTSNPVQFHLLSTSLLTDVNRHV